MFKKLFGSKRSEKKKTKVTITEEEYERLKKQTKDFLNGSVDWDEVDRLQKLVESTPKEDQERQMQLSIDIARALHLPEENIIHCEEELKKRFGINETKSS